MRRVAGLLLGLVLVFTGCRGATAAEPIGEGFTCAVKAIYRDLEVSGTLTRDGAGRLGLTFDEPSTLKGLTVQWDGENVTLSLGGMSFSVSPDAVPERALGEEIVSAFDTALRGEGKRTTENGKLIVEGNGSNGAYTLVFDAKTGEPLSLSVPALPLTVTFSDVSKRS